MTPVLALSAALLTGGCQSGGSAVSSYNGGQFKDQLSTKSGPVRIARHERGEAGSRRGRGGRASAAVASSASPHGEETASSTPQAEPASVTAADATDSEGRKGSALGVTTKGPTILAALAGGSGSGLPGVDDPFARVQGLNRLPSARPDSWPSKRVVNGAGAPIMARGPLAKAMQRRAKYAHIIRKYAKAHGVPVKLAMAVVQIESMFRPNAVGAAGEIGLMQILPRTARYIGYKGPMKALHDPETNISFGMKYLGKAHRLGGGSTCGTILKYNAGHGAKKMNSVSREYCRRVTQILQET